MLMQGHWYTSFKLRPTGRIRCSQNVVNGIDGATEVRLSYPQRCENLKKKTLKRLSLEADGTKRDMKIFSTRARFILLLRSPGL